jgi:hypothetical protein
MNRFGLARVGAGVLLCVGCGGQVSGQTLETDEPATVTQGVVLEPIDPAKELMITDLSVVNDVRRTVWKGGQGEDGAWTFGRLMMAMADTDKADVAADFVRAWLEEWQRDQTFNGDTAPARPTIQSTLIDPWPKRSDGRLDLTKAPFRLLAIAFRPDLRNVNAANGQKQTGEGRFVFGVLGPTGNALPFTVILEYGIPGAQPSDVRTRSREWHELGKKAFGTADFNSTLKSNTDKFAKRDGCNLKPNGSCINQIRTNEVTLAAAGTDLANTPSTKLWELREFRIDASTGRLHQTPVAQTTPLASKGGQALADFINANEAAVVQRRHVVPSGMLAASALAPKGAFLDNPAIANPDARFGFAVTTCDGCHTTETGTAFLHIRQRASDQPSQLSAFLTGGSTLDPVTGQERTFNDLASRARDLQWVLFQATDVELGKAPKKTAPH